VRPNYSQDAPPTAITVGGFSYPVDADFRTWIRVVKMLGGFIPAAATPEHVQHNADLMCELQTAVFGGVLEDEDPSEALKAISDFAQGYPNAPIAPSGRQHEATYSFEYDLNFIIIAIRNQSGIDLSYRRKEPFHWWEFLLEFSSLCGDHYILRLMEIRGYDKNPEKPESAKARCALPREKTAAQEAVLEDINAEFYGA
jgi:hypothetical protein